MGEVSDHYIEKMQDGKNYSTNSRKDSEMQHTGNITAIQPLGGYDSRNGYIYTFSMTVNTPAGPINGEIGSKAQVYPKNPGDQITIEVTSDPQHGNKFKNINPQYAGQDQQPQQQGFQQQPHQQQAPPQQQPAQQQSYTPPPQTPPRDTGLSIERQASFKAACHRFQGMSEATDAEIMRLAALGANFCLTGNVAEQGSGDQFAQDYDLPV